MKKRKIIIVIIVLFILIIFSSFISKKHNYTYSESITKVQIDNSNLFVVMVEDNNGDYKENNSEDWLSKLKYVFNSEKSGCVNAEGNIINDVLTFNEEKWTVKILLKEATYCYIYFDLDKTILNTFEFYLGGSSNPEYTNTVDLNGYLKIEEDDIEKYCLTTDDNSNNCEWITIENKEMNINYKLSDENGTKRVYAYLKDYAGNISEKIEDTIILDTIKPVISLLEKTNDETNSIEIKITASDSNGIEKYYYSIDNGSIIEKDINTNLFEGLTIGTSYLVKVYVKDKAGNISEEKIETISTKNYYCPIGELNGTKCIANASTEGWTTTKYYNCSYYQSYTENCSVCGEEYYCDPYCENWYSNCMSNCSDSTCTAYCNSEYALCVDVGWCNTRCKSCTKYISASCPYTDYYCASGWSTYSGSGSSLKCTIDASTS